MEITDLILPIIADIGTNTDTDTDTSIGPPVVNNHDLYRSHSWMVALGCYYYYLVYQVRHWRAYTRG